MPWDGTCVCWSVKKKFSICCWKRVSRTNRIRSGGTFVLFSAFFQLHVSRLVAAPSPREPHGNFWHIECFLLDCITYISSSVVIEIPVSSAWCVNVIQISFYSRGKKKENVYYWVLFVHKAFWKSHWTLLGCCPCTFWRPRWALLPVVEDIFKMLNFVFQSIDGDDSQSVAWRLMLE